MQSSNKNYLRLLQATGILVVFASLLLLLGPVSVQAINSSSDATITTNLSELSSGSCTGTPVTIGNDTVYFDGVRYDYPIAGQSTWYYCVESGRRPAISHVTYDLNLTGEGGCQTIADQGTWGATQNDLNSGAGIPVTGNDPRTSIYGLKFDQGFNDNESRNYYFTMNGNLVSEDITLATKAGRGFDVGLISGPSSTCEEQGGGDDPPVANPEFSDEDLAKMCFAISDGYFDENGEQHRDSNANDTLGYLNRLTGQSASVDAVIPNIATYSIEGMAFKPGGKILYAANAKTLGTIDLSNGDYTPVALDGDGDPVEFGTGEGYYASSGSLRNETFNDVDSLTFDVITGVFWGVERSGSRPDMLIQIDPATGLYIPDVFNNPDPSPSPGDSALVDYLQVEWQDGLQDIDDIASDPVTGVLYAIMNQGGGSSKLVIIDTTDGTTTEVGWYTRADTGEIISDMEGLAFFNDGRLYGSTGKDFNDVNVLWQIDTETAVATSVGEFTNRMVDIEALGCLTAPAFVAIEKSTNGVDADNAPGPYIEVGESVTWDYFVRNTGGRTLYNIQVTDDQEGAICTIPQLDIGQSNVDVGVTCQETGTPASGQYANMASVTGNDSPDGESGTEYSDSDPSHYYGYTPAAVGDYVWRDTNANGIQDTFEVGVFGVVVNLYNANDDSLLGTTTTNENGFYLFDTLAPGDYYLDFELPEGYDRFSDQDEGSDNEVDSDADTNTGRTDDFNLTSNETDLTWDAGLVGEGAPASIGDVVWEDLNADGIQDDGEPGIEGVTVTLYDIGGNEQDNTTTAADGSYSFTELDPGDYYLVFDQPAGYLVSPANAGADDVDSDADSIFGGDSNRRRTSFTQLSAGENDTTWDAGYYRVGSIGDTVWQDDDANGAQNGGEAGIPDVTVILSDSEGNVVATTVTDADGNYLFEDVLAGDYTVSVDPSTLPTGLGQSYDLNGPLDDMASVSLPAGGTNLEVDFGYAPENLLVASIGDRVWNDTNSDGIQDDGEPGIGGVTVTLYDADDNEIGSTTTAADGSYSFTDLVPGDYYLIFTGPGGYEASPQDANGNSQDSADSDAHPDTGRTATTTLTADENDTTWDAGFYQAGSIGDTVWMDSNGDGIQQDEEDGIAGVTVTLTDSGGNVVGTMDTDADGHYLFSDLPADDYTVSVDVSDIPDEVAQTYDLDGTLDNETTVTLATGENINTADFGYQPVGSIGDTVWEDLNADGVQDGGEAGIENVTVTLKDADGNTLATDTTDSNGNYLFSDLPPGTYTVEVDSSTLPGGEVQTYDLDGDLDHQTVVVLAVGEDRDDVDFGYVLPASLGNFVWDDSNADGIQNNAETGIEGVTVNLLDSDGNVIATDSTDISGTYSFTGLFPGDYVVEFDHDSAALAGFTASPVDAGGDDTLDSDADRTTGRTITISLTAGENDDSWDAGFYEGGSIGDYIWLDEDGDTVQDGDEEGIPGVTLILKDGDGNEIARTVTDENGGYLFDELPAGDYTIEIDTSTLPEHLLLTSDPEGANDHMADVTLTQGQDNLDIDFGYDNKMPSISIQKTVYLDHDSGVSCEGGEQVVGENGDAVTYCFQVTNTGNTYLNDITINDPTLGITEANMSLLSGDDSQPLAPGDSLVYYYQTTIMGDIMSTATASGNPTEEDGTDIPDAIDPTDDDTAEVEEVNPAIDIQKTVLAGHHNRNACPGSELVIGEDGDAVTYCYVITNTGDTYLNNFVFVDADLGITRTLPFLLPPGAIITGTMQTIINGDLVNTGSVTANPVDENGEDIPNVGDVSDDDTAEVQVVAAAIQIENTVYAGHNDGAFCPGGELVAGDLGDPVTYCFVVTNTGDTHLNGIQISDNDLGIKLSSDVLLAPGASVTLHVESTINGDLVNTAVVTANPVNETGQDLPNVDDVSDDDTSEVEKNTPDINLQTTVYVGHDSGAGCPGGELASGVTGSNVTYCFVVTNTSGETLDNITINDSTLAITQDQMTLLSGGSSLAPGETLVYYYQTTITNELINTATVTATDEGGDEVSDEDSAEVDQVAPAIELQNTVYAGHSDGSACPGGELVSGYNGDAVTYCFLVTNTGDTYLGSITIDDTDLGINLTQDVLLAPGESTTIYYDGQINGDLVNTATASGNPTDDEGIDLPDVDNPTDDDTAEVEELACITSIGDTIFLDSDADGEQAGNEPGISGVVVNLVGAGADGVLGTGDDIDGGSQTTDSDGFYNFTGLAAGTYRVDVDESTLPEGYQLTTGNEPMIVEVSECEAYEDADFGYAASVCETSLMYGVFDANTSDTQFFTLDLGTGVASALGPQYDEYDIEAIEIHPDTGTLYAVAGGGGDQDGNVFSVDKETGALTSIGNTGIGVDDNEIVSAAFDPQANLWVFQENVGLFTIDVGTATATQEWAAAFGDNWEGLAWEPEGNYLYASEGRNLYRWDAADDSVEQMCGADFLPYETEALDFRFDGKFLGGSDKTNDSSLSIFEIDVDSCQITPTDYDIPYNDVESLTSEACVEEGFVEGTVGGGTRSVGGVADLDVRLDADVNGDGTYSFSTQTTTNEQGDYSFSNLPFGNYRLSIENSATETVEFSLGDGSDYDYEEVQLQYDGPQYTIMLPVIQSQ